VAGLPHHYTQLVEIQAQRRLTAELFDNILVFENYPVQEHEMFGSGAAGKDRPFHVLAYDDYVQSNYGFTLSATPGETLTLKFMYDGHRYADHDVEAVREGLHQLIACVTADPSRGIADVTGHLAQLEQATQKERSQQFKMKNIGKLKSKIVS
jgi:bacitracin synthase 3